MRNIHITVYLHSVAGHEYHEMEQEFFDDASADHIIESSESALEVFADPGWKVKAYREISPTPTKWMTESAFRTHMERNPIP